MEGGMDVHGAWVLKPHGRRVVCPLDGERADEPGSQFFAIEEPHLLADLVGYGAGWWWWWSTSGASAGRRRAARAWVQVRRQRRMRNRADTGHLPLQEPGRAVVDTRGGERPGGSCWNQEDRFWETVKHSIISVSWFIRSVCPMD